jgi:hypothetical protein
MRYFTSALCTAVGVGLLAACAGNLSGQSGSVPGLISPSRVAQANNRAPISLVAAWMRPTGIQRLHLGTAFPDKKKKAAGGLYGSEFYSNATSDAEGLINAYPNPNSKNSAPTCTIDGYAINGWGVDLKQNLILPSASTASLEPSVNIYAGPKLCGKLLGSIPDTNGQASDAKSFDATKDSIYVGEILSSSTGEGDILICSLKMDSCGPPVTNSSITGYGGGIAADTKGDCWMSAATSATSGFLLVYWKGCKGKGAVATGTKNAGFGGLFFDAKGNLVSIDVTGALYVYSGCDPKCKVVSSSTLKGDSIFGNLNQKGDEVAIGDVTNVDVDVYKYAPTGLKYLYSFNNDLDGTGFTEAAGFSPTNKNL